MTTLCAGCGHPTEGESLCPQCEAYYQTKGYGWEEQQ